MKSGSFYSTCREKKNIRKSLALFHCSPSNGHSEKRSFSYHIMWLTQTKYASWTEKLLSKRTADSLKKSVKTIFVFKWLFRRDKDYICAKLLHFIHFILLQGTLFFKENHILVDSVLTKYFLSLQFFVFYTAITGNLKFIRCFTQRTNVTHKNRS